MMRLAKYLVQAAVIMVLAGALPAGPVRAQADPDMQGPPAPPKIIPTCRNSRSDDIVVCARPKRSPYRLPEAPAGFDPDGDEDSVSRERNGLMDEGASGIGSCSTVGPGGGSGCSAAAWRRGHEQSDGHGRKKGLISKVRNREEPDPIPPRR